MLSEANRVVGPPLKKRNHIAREFMSHTILDIWRDRHIFRKTWFAPLTTHETSYCVQPAAVHRVNEEGGPQFKVSSGGPDHGALELPGARGGGLERAAGVRVAGLARGDGGAASTSRQ